MSSNKGAAVPRFSVPSGGLDLAAILNQHGPPVQKAVDGPIVAQTIGLLQMRAERHRFNAWIERPEAFGTV